MSEKLSPPEMSRTAEALAPPAVFATTMRRSLAAGMSMLSTPTAKFETTFSCGPAASSARITCMSDTPSTIGQVIWRT